MTTSGSNDLAAFRRALRRCAADLSRDLPWIGHPSPWAVLVSEVMLQQTQTSRVVDPWRHFLAAYPTPTECANAPLSEVLTRWAGLGYHRRAKALHDAAQMLRDDFAGVVPCDVSSLRTLPGVGEYTANAVASFAFAQPVAVVDTNVGRVLARAVTNRTLPPREARSIANDLLPRTAAAAFNQAMLDLGAQFCRSTPRCSTCPVASHCRWQRDGGPDPAPRSAAVSRPQSVFEGSDRQLRGRVLERLRRGACDYRALAVEVSGGDERRAELVVASLVRDGLVRRRGRRVQLAS